MVICGSSAFLFLPGIKYQLLYSKAKHGHLQCCASSYGSVCLTNAALALERTWHCLLPPPLWRTNQRNSTLKAMLHVSQSPTRSKCITMRQSFNCFGWADFNSSIRAGSGCAQHDTFARRLFFRLATCFGSFNTAHFGFLPILRKVLATEQKSVFPCCFLTGVSCRPSA